MSTAAPGWYPDNRDPLRLRYWDGSAWTGHTMAQGRPVPHPARRPGPRRGLVAGLLAGAGAIATVVLFVVAALAVGTDQSGPPSRTSGEPARAGAQDPDPALDQSASGRDRQSARKSRGADEGAAGKDAGAGMGAGMDAGKDAGKDAGADQRQRHTRTVPQSTRAPAPRPRTFLVTRVVDGDTLELGNGETVRLVGVDTPEVGECGYDRASAALAGLVSGRQVRLTRSDEDRDGYGRLLRYVDVGGVDAGLRQIRGGLAIARYDSRDGYGSHPREPRYVAADGAARNLSCPKPAPAPQPLVGGACAPGYSPCVPPYPPDVDCADVNGPIRVTGSDPHGLDADGDGVACE